MKAYDKGQKKSEQSFIWHKFLLVKWRMKKGQETTRLSGKSRCQNIPVKILKYPHSYHFKIHMVRNNVAENRNRGSN